MWSLNGFDYSVIGIYFLALIVLGLALERMASKSIEDYFIGGRRLPWWALGVSGMAFFLDMTGTMIITSFLFLLGPRGLFIEFRGGAVLVLAFMMLWGGKWHRRSKCLTGAEWMVFRFGDGFGGRFAQGVSALAGIVSAIGMLAYLIKGSGLFLTMFFPFSPFWCTVVLIGITTIYTMISGFYGVVFTDLFQSAIILFGVIIISVMAMTQVAAVPDFAAVAAQVTNNSQWMSTMPQWHTEMPPGYEMYESLVMFAFFYLLRNIFAGVSAGADPRYLGARNDRECGLLTAFWTVLMTLRWPMMMGFAALGILLVHNLFPDQTVLTQASELIKQQVQVTEKAQWDTVVAAIANNPEQYPKEFIAGLQALLGADGWTKKLMLVSFEGGVDPERILPAVLLFNIPPGLRGLMLIVLLAAAMSTFNATVNGVTGFITRDVYQKYLRPTAKTRELISVSWAAVLLLVALSFMFAYYVKSINDVWDWLIMGLGAGLMIPGLLRLFWWRFNGGGFAVGTFVGLAAAIVQRMFFPDLDSRLQFLFLGAVGTAASVIGAYLTKPEDHEVVARFYRITRPFGFWGPFRKLLPEQDRIAMDLEHRRDVLCVPFALLWQVTMFLLPMQVVIGAWTAFYPTLALFLVGLAGVYFFWYRHLPAENYFEPGEEAGVKLAHEELEATAPVFAKEGLAED
ncbi:MAG: sodium:solute symporter [FCB group bacterium]|jgi:Na+/proline symporter|nr:sodium:solute symporter [FCB group bacterium]